MADDAFVPGAMYGSYQLVQRIGRGGMAQVWRAKALGPAGFARDVVLKRVQPGFGADRSVQKMFIREAQLSSLLNHANIVHVLDFGELDGSYYLAMEFVDGVTLLDAGKLLGARGRDPGFGAFVAHELCRALHYAYRLPGPEGAPLRLIHRDISPSNVMLAHEGSVRLLDFGIAKALSTVTSQLTDAGTIKGKLAYMSPEQIDGHALDQRSDLYAVGVVLHETLTGERYPRRDRLFGHDGVDEPAMSTRVRNPAVPEALDEICLRALERDREARFADAGEMSAALGEILHDLGWGQQQVTQLLASGPRW